MRFTFDSVAFGKELPERTVYFDATCKLCSGAVDFIRRHQRVSFGFVPLHVSEFRDEESGSLIYLEKGKYFRRSDAVFKIARQLKWPYSWLYVLIIVPRPLRDWVYNFVSRNRYRWFGRCETCHIHS